MPDDFPGVTVHLLLCGNAGLFPILRFAISVIRVPFLLLHSAKQTVRFILEATNSPQRNLLLKNRASLPLLLLSAAFLAGVCACNRDPLDRLYGTWSGKTKTDQDITITIGRDSTIAIETVEDSVRKVQKGTYLIIDRRIRISLTTMETYEGDNVTRQKKTGADEAVFTLTRGNELILRRGLQAIVLQKVSDSP